MLDDSQGTRKRINVCARVLFLALAFLLAIAYRMSPRYTRIWRVTYVRGRRLYELAKPPVPPA